MPSWNYEKEAYSRFGNVVAGVDEAGRGPLAGPVVAGAVILDKKNVPTDLLCHLDDSKKLSPKKRDVLFHQIMNCPAATTALGVASVEEIDHLNILRAAHLAMQRAVSLLGVMPAVALIDGNQAPRHFSCPTMCVVKGDSHSFSIAAASIIAKVNRDRKMTELAVGYPGYGWEKNMGYGTAEHRHAVRSLGLTPHHRRSFAGLGAMCSAV